MAFDPILINLNPNNEKPIFCKVMICQLKYEDFDWDIETYTPYHFIKDNDKLRGKIEELLQIAKTEEVNIVVFPELCIPESFVATINEWVINTYQNICIIGGTHYKISEKKIESKCPIFINGEIKYTEKTKPSRDESTPDHTGYHLIEGKIINIFNTPFGRFAVLICVDYIDESITAKINSDIDFLIIVSSNTAPRFYSNMSDHCLNSNSGMYILYSNLVNKSKYLGSAIFGQLDQEKHYLIQNKGYSDFNPKEKIFEFDYDTSFVVVKLNLDMKKVSKITGNIPAETITILKTDKSINETKKSTSNNIIESKANIDTDKMEYKSSRNVIQKEISFVQEPIQNNQTYDDDKIIFNDFEKLTSPLKKEIKTNRYGVIWVLYDRYNFGKPKSIGYKKSDLIAAGIITSEYELCSDNTFVSKCIEYIDKIENFLKGNDYSEELLEKFKEKYNCSPKEYKTTPFWKNCYGLRI